MTSSVRSSGQWATKLRMAAAGRNSNEIRGEIVDIKDLVQISKSVFVYHTVLQLGPPG